MFITLRRYQQEAVNAWDEFVSAGGKKGLIHLPTGCGKTITALSIARNLGGRMLWIAHRGELLDQAIEAMKIIWPDVSCGVVKAERNDIYAHCVFASIQSVHKRLDSIKNQFDLVVVDEAHHIAARTYQETIEAANAPLLLGLTATPYRGDKVALDDCFDEIVYSMEIEEAITQGYLSDLKTKVMRLNLSFEELHLTAGDYNQGELSDLLIKSEVPQRVAEVYVEEAQDRKTIIFTVSKAQADLTCQHLKQYGVSAEMITGDTPEDERRDILHRFKQGQIKVLTNCMVLTEGFDEPSVDCIIMARPTKSKPLYVQCMGRGTRKFPGKENCLVIDLTGRAGIFNNMTAPQLFGLGCIEETESIVQEIEDYREEEERRKSDQEAARLRKLLYSPEAIEMRNNVRWVMCEPDLFALPAGNGSTIMIRACDGGWETIVAYRDRSIQPLVDEPTNQELAQAVAEDYIRRNKGKHLVQNTAKWRRDLATEKQKETLSKFGINCDDEMTKGEAMDEITKAIAKLNNRGTLRWKRQCQY